MRNRNARSRDARRVARYATFCGIGAGLASQAVIAAAALAEGQPVARPVNATSHWLWGEEAGREAKADLAHTGIGALTNEAAGMFWGTLFAMHVARRPDHGPVQIMRDAAALGIIASIVDYGLIPRRLTPGWELALSRKSVALGMASMALGLGLGALAARATER